MSSSSSSSKDDYLKYFPFSPYNIQKDLMKNMTQVLDRGGVGIFESPTGTGKSTQVPAMILESERFGPSCQIAVTQPRRISAVSLAARCAEERGETVGDSIGYSIRLERSCSKDTQVTFMTTGVRIIF